MTDITAFQPPAPKPQSLKRQSLKPLSHLDSPLEVVRQFTPQWFTVTMGTGVLALTLAQFPGDVPVLKHVAEGLWLLNIGLFVVFSGLYAARWAVFPDGARRIFDHPVMSMFFGAVPMGLATIVNGFLVIGIRLWGPVALDIAQALWWVDVGLAVACGVAVPHLMFTRQSHGLERMTAVWLLPLVAAEVAAVSGGLLAPHLADAHGQLTVLIASYVLWACSVPAAMGILVILVLRMAIHKLPPAAMAATHWLALGPIGTGALGLLVLGAAAPAVFAANGLAVYGSAAPAIGLFAGVILWGYGLWWMATAALNTLRHLREGLPFNIGWWGYTFPLGVYALATLKLAALLPIAAFAVFGAAQVIALAALWLIIGARTAHGAWRGTLFHAPCLAEG